MILKLTDICKTIGVDISYHEKEVIPSPTVIDDIFRVLRKREIAEVEVNFDQMFLIVMYTIANIQSYNEQSEMNWDALNIIKKGQMDEFFGVKLKLVV